MQEIKMYLLCCRLHMRRVKYYKCMWPWCDCKRATKPHERVCPLTNIIKDQTAKSKITWNQVRVLARQTLTIFLYQQRTSRLHVVMKMIYNCPKKSELPTFILPVKISWLRFLWWKWKICRDQSRLTFLSRLWHAVHPYSVSILACAPTWSNSYYALISTFHGQCTLPRLK